MRSALTGPRPKNLPVTPWLAAFALLGMIVPASVRTQQPTAVPAQEEPAAHAVPGLAKPAALPSSAIREEVIGQMTPGNELETVTSGAGHLLWVEKKGDYRIGFFDGKQQGGEYESVSSLQVSADGRHCAFVGELSARQFVVVDGQKLPGEYTRIADLHLGPETASYTFTGCFGEQCHLVVNGKELGPAYQDIQSPSFTADHEHYFYLAEQDDKWLLVHDGQEEGPKWEDSGSLWISPDGRHTALAARSKRKWAWVVDGAPGPVFPVISPLGIGEGGQHYIYAGVTTKLEGLPVGMVPGMPLEKGLAASVVVDGKVTGLYQGAGRLALYKGVPGMVARAKLHLPYGFLEQRYGPSSSGSSGELLGLGVHMLLAKWDGASNPFMAGSKTVYAAKRGDNDFAVFADGIPGPGFEDVSLSIAASHDGKHIAYVGLRGGSFTQVIDQQTGRSFPRERDADFVGQVVLSDDAAHLGYELIGWGVHQRAKRRMVVDGQSGAVYDALAFLSFQFSSDGRHHAFVISGAHGDQDLVIFDGMQSPLYDTVVADSLGFSGDHAIRFIAQKGRAWVRVSESLE